MIDLNEAYKLEELEKFIDDKSNELHDLNDSYEFFLRKLNTFVNEYSKKVKELSDLLNKNIDEMHKSIDSFKTIYLDSINELKDKEKNTLSNNDEFNGDYSKELAINLNRKLNSEIDKMKNSSKKMEELYMEEYNKSLDNINKLNQRLNKLKDRSFK